MVAPPENAHPVHMDPSISPETETELEQELPGDPRLRAALDWGTPRFGPPEGRVADNGAAALEAIPSDDPLRGDPRFLALVHDSCKAEVPPHQQWSPDNDHPTLVRRFAERYTVDERLLSTLELHDKPFLLWRHDAAPEQALRLLLEQLPDPELFARFVVELDAANEGKGLTFLRRFRREPAIAGRLPPIPRPPTGDGQHVVYIKAFATSPELQSAVARAANELVAEKRTRMRAEGEVLTSDDGLPVVLRWRSRGSPRELIERDADAISEALAAHPITADARAVEAHLPHAKNQ